MVLKLKQPINIVKVAETVRQYFQEACDLKIRSADPEVSRPPQAAVARETSRRNNPVEGAGLKTLSRSLCAFE